MAPSSVRNKLFTPMTRYIGLEYAGGDLRLNVPGHGGKKFIPDAGRGHVFYPFFQNSR